jgi:hypothetical protein
MIGVEVKEEVKKLAKYLNVSDDFVDVTVDVTEDEDNYVLLNIRDQFLYVEITSEEEIVTGIGGRELPRTIPRTKIIYTPGYYKQINGSYFEPPEEVEVPLKSCSNIMDACVEIVAFMYSERLFSIAEADAHVEEMLAEEQYREALILT